MERNIFLGYNFYMLRRLGTPEKFLLRPEAFVAYRQKSCLRSPSCRLVILLFQQFFPRNYVPTFSMIALRQKWAESHSFGRQSRMSTKFSRIFF